MASQAGAAVSGPFPRPRRRTRSKHYPRNDANGHDTLALRRHAGHCQCGADRAPPGGQQAASGDEIWVAAGAHTPSASGNRAATFPLKSGVAAYGGFAMTETLRTERDPVPHITLLGGDQNGNDSGFSDNDENSYHVVIGATGATLDGVTIAGGNANDGTSCLTACGDGMYNDASSPTLTDVTFSGNLAYVGGRDVQYLQQSDADRRHLQR